MQEPSATPSPPIPAPPTGRDLPGVGKCQSALLAYCQDADVSWCALVDERGRLLGSASPKGFAPRHPEEMGSMTSELIRSAQLLASRLGEREFRGFFQAGERWHYFVSPITDRALLLSVFDSNVLAAAVRSSTETHRERIALAL